VKDFYLVFKNLTRKKMRLFLTIFATFIAFTIFGTLTAFQKAFDAGVDLAADDRLVVLNKINFTQPLPIAYFNRVRAVEHVSAVTHLNWFGGYYQEPRNFIGTFAVDVDTFVGVYDELVMSDEETEAWMANRQGLIAGKSVAEQYGWQKGDRIPLNSNIFTQYDGSSTWDFDVIAIYEGVDPQTDTSSVYFHYDYFNETQSFGGDSIGWMAVRTDDPNNNERVIKDIDALFANSPAETETIPEKAFNKAFLEQIGNLSLILTSVVFAAFFVILVIVGNSMVLSIRERTSEIGVLKTVGFTSARVFRMVLAESMLLALIGGILGVSTSAVLVMVVNSAPIQLPTLVLDAEVWTEALLIMLTLGFITGIVPAMNALRLNIITALSRS